MIRKFLSAVILLALSSVQILADDTSSVELSNDHKEQSVSVNDQCDLVVKLERLSNDGKANIAIEVDNISREYEILLFNMSYSVRELKKQRPSIRHDKRFRKIDPIITPCYKLTKQERIEPARKKSLCINVEINQNEKATVKLPMYFARYKGRSRKKMLLMSKVEKELVISVIHNPTQPNPLDKDIEDFIARYSGDYKLIFCKQSGHKETSQYKKYDSRKEAAFKKEQSELIGRIEWQLRNYMSTDQEYKEYDAKRQEIRKLKYEVVYKCPNCSPPPQRCQLCQKTYTAEHKECSYCRLSDTQLTSMANNLYNQWRAGGSAAIKARRDAEAVSKCYHAKNLHKKGYDKIIECLNRMK